MRGLQGAGLQVHADHPAAAARFRGHAARQPNLAIGPGSAREFKVTARADRRFRRPDPRGYRRAAAGFSRHDAAGDRSRPDRGAGRVIAAAADAAQPSAEQAKASKVTASATIGGREVVAPGEQPGRAQAGRQAEAVRRDRAGRGGRQAGGRRSRTGRSNSRSIPAKPSRCRSRSSVPATPATFLSARKARGRNLPFGVMWTTSA